MVNDEQFNINILRGWQRSQLKLLKEFTIRPLISQAMLSTASGATVGSHELGGKITALTRAGLIQKAGKGEDGQWLWQLNEEKINKTELQKFIESLRI